MNYSKMTVGELIGKLQEFDANTKVSICGFSYDSTIEAHLLKVELEKSEVVIYASADKGKCTTVPTTTWGV